MDENACGPFLDESITDTDGTYKLRGLKVLIEALAGVFVSVCVHVTM